METREKWLLTILSGIFFVQAAVFIYGFRTCANVEKPAVPTDVCPEIGRRFDNTFGGMVATTLALLTGASVLSANKKDKKLPPVLPPPPPKP